MNTEPNLEALYIYLSKEVPDFGEIQELKTIVGGYSNLTYQLQTSGKKYILRTPPKGAEGIKGGHNMEREFDILKKISEANYAKVPKVWVYCSDKSIVGTVFYVMERVDGLILRPSSKAQMPEFLSEATTQNLSKGLCKTLAEIHKIDINATNLISIGKPEGYISRQVNGWYERYLASKTEENAIIESIYQWLTEKMPAEISATLIHNDFKYDNVVFDQETQKIKAVLDWEMATVGDPRMDIGTCLSYWVDASESEFLRMTNITWLSGNLTRDEFIDEYLKVNPIDLDNILYFYVFGTFKNAVVLQQIYSRYVKGLTQDPRFAQLNIGVNLLLDKAKRSIDLGQMA